MSGMSGTVAVVNGTDGADLRRLRRLPGRLRRPRRLRRGGHQRDRPGGRRVQHRLGAAQGRGRQRRQRRRLRLRRPDPRRHQRAAATAAAPATASPARCASTTSRTRAGSPPHNGEQVTNVPGIVTGVRTAGSSRGYWIQDPDPDSSPATSEGIFVFTSSPGRGRRRLGARVGHRPRLLPALERRLRGDDVEPVGDRDRNARRSSCARTPTRCRRPRSSAPARCPTPTPRTSTARNIESTPITPSRSALDFWESREGMRVEVDDARVVGPSNSFGEQFVTTKPAQAATYRGGTEILAENAIPSGRVEVVPANGSNPGVDVGDVFGGATVGPVDYSQFGGYVIAATTLGTRPAQPPGAGHRRRAERQAAGGGDLQRREPGARRPRLEVPAARLRAWSPTSPRPTSWPSRRSRTTPARPTTAPSRPTRP